MGWHLQGQSQASTGAAEGQRKDTDAPGCVLGLRAWDLIDGMPEPTWRAFSFAFSAAETKA